MPPSSCFAFTPLAEPVHSPRVSDRPRTTTLTARLSATFQESSITRRILHRKASSINNHYSRFCYTLFLQALTTSLLQRENKTTNKRGPLDRHSLSAKRISSATSRQHETKEIVSDIRLQHTFAFYILNRNHFRSRNIHNNTHTPAI